jgi:hypothetical protein
MMKIVKWLFIISYQVLLQYDPVLCQNRWVKSYFSDMDTPVHDIVEAYDKGYLMVGKFGANYSKYNWLIKTDINGDILWQKTIGNEINSIAILDMVMDSSGNIYLGGSTTLFDPSGDPFIMKLNPCGEKEWCRIFYTENNHDFSRCISLTTDESIAIVLNYTNPQPFIDRICLAKLSQKGDLLWKQCYTSTDTSQRNEEPYDILTTPDDGFLITGFCYYEDPEVPNLWWLHPYHLKVDSIGNFEWETVVYKETNMHGGIAGSTVVSHDLKYYYSSISHYYNDTNLASPALVKLDMQGNVIGVYDVVSGYKEGKLSYAQFLNDSTLAADAAWGNSADDLWSHAVIIDTLGNLLNSTVLVYDIYTSILQITYDSKLAYASNTYQNNQFDCFLTKLNQDLEDDTLYTRPFAYDSLCPYQIVSDTIVQDDCELIVGIEEQDGGNAGGHGSGEAGKPGGMEVWPNPASGVLNVKCLGLSAGSNRLLIIYDVYGRKMKEISVPAGQDMLQTDVRDFHNGIYFIKLFSDHYQVSAAKFLIAR